MKKLFIICSLFCLGLNTVNAAIKTQAADTSISKKIALLEEKVTKQEKEITKLKAENASSTKKGTPVVTRRKHIITRTGSKQIVAVD